MMTRVREPLEYYLSFYRWGVAFRQRDEPTKFGKDFIDWAQRVSPTERPRPLATRPWPRRRLNATPRPPPRQVPNLQSVTMMASMAAMAAEYHVEQWAHWSKSKLVGKSDEEAWEKLTAFLDDFAIVGTMKRFDESLLMASDLVGLPLMLYKRNHPHQKGGFKGTSKDVCPDMELCRSVIKRVAARDHRMYDRYSANFEKRIEALGPQFAVRPPRPPPSPALPTDPRLSHPPPTQRPPPRRNAPPSTRAPSSLRNSSGAACLGSSSSAAITPRRLTPYRASG